MDATAQGGGEEKRPAPHSFAFFVLCSLRMRGRLAPGSRSDCDTRRSFSLNLPPLTRYNGGVSFRIRQFQKADFDTLWRIDQACFEPQLAYSRPAMAFYMRRPGAFTLVAEGGEVRDNGDAPAGILGFIVAETRRKSGHIINIDVVAE